MQHQLLALQADAQLANGKPEAALASVAAGLQAVEKTGGAPLEAELYRLKGEALLAGAGSVDQLRHHHPAAWRDDRSRQLRARVH
jgi:hypothetical protein